MEGIPRHNHYRSKEEDDEPQLNVTHPLDRFSGPFPGTVRTAAPVRCGIYIPPPAEMAEQVDCDLGEGIVRDIRVVDTVVGLPALA